MPFQPARWGTRSVNVLARFEIVWQLSFGSLAGTRKIATRQNSYANKGFSRLACANNILQRRNHSLWKIIFR